MAFIKAHLAFLPHYITKLEEHGMQVTNAVQLMEDARSKLDSVPGEAGKKLKTKMDSILEKNPGFCHIKHISGVLTGTTSTVPDGMAPRDVALFKYCPTTCVDVEKSYKNILTD